MVNRTPLRIHKVFDRYEVKTGNAGFVILLKNGKRIQPKNKHLIFNLRNNKGDE